MMTQPMHNDELRSELDAISAHAARQLDTARARDAVRSGLGPSLVLVAVVPAVVVLAQLLALAVGGAPATLFSWWIAPLAALPALAHLAWRLRSTRAVIGRRRALAAVDTHLHASDRLVTADAFLAAPTRDGFMLAAIEDAGAFMERGRSADVTPAPIPARVRWWQSSAVALGAAFVVIAFLLSTVVRPAPVVAMTPTPRGGGIPGLDDPLPIATPAADRAPTEPPPTSERRAVSDRSSARSRHALSEELPDAAEVASGSMGTGRTSESDQSSSPSNARGAPSAQGQPSKSGASPKRKAGTPSQRPNDPTQKERPEDPQEEPSGSTAGQGSSKGSNRNPAASDWSSRDQISTPADDEVEDEDDIDDEDEEQESRGGLQPNLRDRRPPVNRDLRIGFGSRNNPDANGRGGPSAQKKSRGVASFVLGVPMTDRVKGQPNPGRTKVTQQRIEPEAEPSDPVDAASRPERDGTIGPVFHPRLGPWMRAIIREYFIDAPDVPGQETP